MTRRFGDRATFAVEIGKALPPGLRIVDLWAAGKRLTTDDDVAYVPHMCFSMRSTAAQVRHRKIRPCPFPDRSPEEVFWQLSADATESRERYWVLDWGEIVDSVSCYAYLDDDLVIVFRFWRADHAFPEDLGKIFAARIAPEEFAATLQQAADLLDADSVR